MIAVCVTFDIKPEGMSAFLPLMQTQAQTSLQTEPDCHRFDVCTQSDAQNRVFLYEIYTDRTAFDVHLASDHFKTFDAAVADLIEAKTVAIFDDVFHG
ncbi:MAG: putative quinol monooxygenase [Paracoccaceae bacterium]